MLSLIATGAVIWTTSTWDLEKKMEKIGWSKVNAVEIINECKKTAKDPKRCVLAASAIGANETQACKFAYKNSCFGVQKAYNSQKEAIKDFVTKYNKHWYKWKDGSHFYGTPQKPAKTHFCMSEESSGSVGHCPNGRKHFDYFISKLK